MRGASIKFGLVLLALSFLVAGNTPVAVATPSGAKLWAKRYDGTGVARDGARSGGPAGTTVSTT